MLAIEMHPAAPDVPWVDWHASFASHGQSACTFLAGQKAALL